MDQLRRPWLLTGAGIVALYLLGVLSLGRPVEAQSSIFGRMGNTGSTGPSGVTGATGSTGQTGTSTCPGTLTNKVLASDFVMTATTTLATMSDFSFTATSGKLYSLSFRWLLSDASTTGVKFGFGEDATARGGILVTRFTSTAGTGWTATGIPADQVASTFAAFQTTGTPGAPIWGEGAYVGNGGTFTFQAAQQVASSTTTIVAGSSVSICQIN